MSGNLKSDAIFNTIKDRLAENPAKGKQINAVFLYNITTTTATGAPVKHWSELFLINFFWLDNSLIN